MHIMDGYHSLEFSIVKYLKKSGPLSHNNLRNNRQSRLPFHHFARLLVHSNEIAFLSDGVVKHILPEFHVVPQRNLVLRQFLEDVYSFWRFDAGHAVENFSCLTGLSSTPERLLTITTE